jgi:hypothetical protein
MGRIITIAGVCDLLIAALGPDARAVSDEWLFQVPA